MATAKGISLSEYLIEYRHFWIEGLRAFLGLLLIYKGYYFVEHLDVLYHIINETTPYSAFVVSHYVVFAHLAGGIMIVFGILTRIAIVAQLPIFLAGAVYFTEEGSAFFGPTTEMEYTLLILILLVVFFFYGAGKWSVDHWIMRRRQENE